MRSGKTPVVLMGKLFLCLWALVACAQELHWDKSMAAAGKARQEGRYSEAERLFIDAIKEVEGFGPGDPRLPASLNSLAELYRTRSKYAEARSEERRVGKEGRSGWLHMRQTYYMTLDTYEIISE